MTTSRRGAALTGLLGLVLVGGCNVVMTEKPLFTAADAAGATPLRPGVWSFFHEAGCQVDESRPFAEWPSCSGGGIVRAGAIAGHKAGAPPGELEREPLIITGGDPRIIQIQVKIDVTAGAEATASGGGEASAAATATSPKEQPYGYAGLKPTRFDGEGRITAFHFWPVLCGPPPPKNAKGEDTALGTLRPLPGLEMKPGDAVCTTHSADALRNAARASQAWDDQRQESHWVRDGEQ